MPCGCAGACRLAALLVLLAMTLALPAVQADTTDNGPHGTEHTHFYLWRTTMTVGESSGQLGYNTASTNSYGSISTDADFNYPPWSPPPKHHFDPDYNFTVAALFLYEQSGVTVLTLSINDVMTISGGTATLWIGNTGFPLNEGSGVGSLNFSSLTDHDLDVPDLDWEEDEEVSVVLSYERALPSAPKNVRVTAPPGEDGTLSVSWDEPDDEGTFETSHYLVEFRPVGDARRFVRSHVPSSKTSVRRTDLETGTEYRVLVQALSGDGYGDPETSTVATRTRAPGNPQALPGITQGPVEPLTEEPVEPLTMRLKGIPNEHDGENHPFVLRMVFSEPVTATEQEMRDHAIEVRGGAVTDARTVGEEDNVWEIEVTPGSDAELSIAVPRVLGCEEEGALCTSDGRELSNGMGVIVAGPSPPPLTAWFEKVPSGHDGERRFKLRIAFSEGIRIGYRTFRDYSVAVKGGHVTRAKRVNRRRDLWEITVEPDSYGDVTVTLVPGRECGTTGAVCTGDGRELSNGIKRVIQGPGGK